MRVWSFVATVVLGGFCATVATAQEAAPATAPQVAVAVVDVGYILKNHPTMKSELEGIRTEMEAADKSIAEKRDSIIKRMEQLREQFTEGTAEYARAEKEIAEADANLRLEIIRHRKSFDERNATILYQAYSQLTSYVKMAADHWGTQVVLKVAREQMDPKKPETVQMVISQEVLYYNPAVDLTEWVLLQLKANASAATAARASTTPR